jgi:hypothetical protein
MRFYAILLTLILTGCATTGVTEFAGPDGTKSKAVKCNQDPNKCFVAATQSCPEGAYRVVSSESHAGGLLADVFAGPVTWYGMTYVCGPSDGKMPDFAFRGQRYTPPPVVMTQPVVTRPAPAPAAFRTTNCTQMGNSVNCSSY